MYELMYDPRNLMVQLEFYIPNLHKILVIIVGGWIFAWVMQWTIRKFLLYVKFDIAAEKAGQDYLQKGTLSILQHS